MSDCKKHGNAMLGVSYPEHDCPWCQSEELEAEKAQKSRASGRWVAIAAGAAVLVWLLIWSVS